MAFPRGIQAESETEIARDRRRFSGYLEICPPLFLRARTQNWTLGRALPTPATSRGSPCLSIQPGYVGLARHRGLSPRRQRRRAPPRGARELHGRRARPEGHQQARRRQPLGRATGSAFASGSAPFDQTNRSPSRASRSIPEGPRLERRGSVSPRSVKLRTAPDRNAFESRPPR